MPPARRAYSRNVEQVAYIDLDDKPAFKLAMQRTGDRWYLVAAHMWEPGWSVVDVTDPEDPKLVKFIEGPPETVTRQIQIADNLMITSLEVPRPGWWEKKSDAPSQRGIYIWDISDPLNPKWLSHYETEERGPHRNFYAGGPYVGLAAPATGYQGNIYEIVDISDPTKPVRRSRWWLAEQWVAGGGKPVGNISHHGPAHMEGNRAYLAYGHGGAIILDVSDIDHPRMISQLQFGASISSRLGCHTFQPLPKRKLAVANTEAIAEGWAENYNYVAMVDIADEENPRIISMFPVPVPPEEAPYKHFQEKGGRFGPHNQHHHQNQPHLLQRDDLVFLTYFNAGLRIFDISDPYVPREVGYFIPPDPVRRHGPQPVSEPLVAQTEDVIVDARGNIFISDKNMGIYVLRYNGL